MRFQALALCCVLLTAAACGQAKHYDLKGQVLAVNRDRQELLIKHDEIPGYMMAMTMPYRVQSPAMLDNVGAGDMISAKLEVKDNAATITEITRTGNAPPQVAQPSPLADGIVMMTKEGDKVPETTLLDEDGKQRTFSDIRDGKATALTFMYTKCPMPTYCPMMDRNFATIQKTLKADPALRGKVRLLSVSFDPKNDTPAVLKQHAKELGADPADWTFVTGTGQDDIDKFAMSFGLTLVRGQAQDPNEIGHTLRTAIIDRDGKLVKTYTGNEWTPDQIVADLKQLQ